MEQELQNTKSVQGITGDAEAEIRKVVNRHMKNEDDVISEEEFRNLKVGVPDTPSQEISEEVEPQSKDENSTAENPQK